MGKIFSIEEFSVFDGDGIRTTVFLKGCPLRCSWCHSPEGQSKKTEILRSPNGCTGCEQCLNATQAVTGKRELSKHSVAACPRALVRICGEEYSPKELLQKLSKNFDILNATGGGVTFSGGEPLLQHKFLLDCLRLLRGKTHRAIQTTGYAPPVKFEEILQEVDLVLYDLKLIDTRAHKRYTGVSNEWILENFQTLARSGVPFIPRIPLIPTVTDTEKNVSEICAFLQNNGVAYAEVLPYNKMAGSKYKLAGRTYAPDFDESVPVQTREEIFKSYAIKVKIL